MLDPFPPPPEWLRRAAEPWALAVNLPTLADHVHEVILAFALYQSIHSFVSPWLSPKLFPKSYPHFNKRAKLNWDVHVVSLVQSVVINGFALWVMFMDRERREMGLGERVYGYTGACGLIQALATGYFVYDLIVSTVYLRTFGVGMFFHGVSALWVFALGFVSLSLPPYLLRRSCLFLVVLTDCGFRGLSSTSTRPSSSSTNSPAPSSISIGSLTRST